MILIAPRENTTLRPGRLLLVPAGQSFSYRFALPTRRDPVYANAFKMTLLRMDNAKLPGMILLHETMIERAALFALRTFLRRNPFRICTLDENRSRQGRAGKSFQMTSLCDDKNNLPAMILLRKKVGGTPRGRTFDAKPSPPRLSLSARANPRALRRSPVRDIISLRNSKGHLA
jgi:hypothetical protein